MRTLSGHAERTLEIGLAEAELDHRDLRSGEGEEDAEAVQAGERANG